MRRNGDSGQGGRRDELNRGGSIRDDELERVAPQADPIAGRDDDLPVDALGVDEGPVRRAEILDQDQRPQARQPRVATGYDGEVDHLIAAWVAADDHLAAPESQGRQRAGRPRQGASRTAPGIG